MESVVNSIKDLFNTIEWAFDDLEQAKIAHYLEEMGDDVEDVTDAISDMDGLKEEIISTIEERLEVKKELIKSDIERI